MSLGSVGHDGDRVSDLFFNKLDIVAAVQGKIFVFPDAADVALPSGKGDVNGFCPGEESGHRKFLRPDAVDFVGDTDGDFIEVAQDIENSKRYIGRALQAAAVTGRNTVVPAHAPPRLRSSSASSPKISETNSPAPTAEEYALLTTTTWLMA